MIEFQKFSILIISKQVLKYLSINALGSHIAKIYNRSFPQKSKKYLHHTIQCYAPTEQVSNTEKNDFYIELSTIYDKTPRGDIITY